MPNNFLRGVRCPLCSRPPNYYRDTEQFKKEVCELVGSEYTVLSEYKNSATKVKFKHNTCGYICDIEANSFLRGSRCPKCSRADVGKQQTKTNEQFVKQIYELVGNEYVFLEKYVNTRTKIKCKHITCGFTWDILPSGFLYRQTRCPQCAESKGEKLIREILEKADVSFKQECSFKNLLGVGGGLLRFDFAVFDKKSGLLLLIEYDGEFHFNEQYNNDSYNMLQIHDGFKNQYCKDNNIPLIRIPYWQFDKIEKILDKWLNKYGLIHNDDIKGIA